MGFSRGMQGVLRFRVLGPKTSNPKAWQADATKIARSGASDASGAFWLRV